MTSYFSSLLWGTSQLDDAIDKATSELLPTGAEDIALNLEICDQIRSKSVQPKDAMRGLKRRLDHKNPNVQLLALSLTDVCVKNGGDPFLTEIASREFMDNLVSILKMPALNHDVKNKILRYIQDWALAFEGKPSLSYVGEVYRTLQREGFSFPPRDPALTSAAMVDTQTAPEWIDSDVCLRCRTAFSFTNRKHHCRNCGQVFDQACSSKSMPLPHFGITQDVRVCDGCHTKLSRKSSRPHRSSQSVSSSRHRSARDLADAELQRAIQLSLEEVGAAGGRRPGYVPSPSSWQASEPPLVDRRTYPSREEEEDPDLKAAIEASLREANAPRPSAPLAVETPEPRSYYQNYENGMGYASSYPPSAATPKPRAPQIPNYDLEPLEADAILTFNQTVEQVQAQGGRDLSRYPAVTELFDKANALRPKLAMNLNDTSRKEELLSEMHDKLSQAVKLYDKLLTEQLSHPAWRNAAASPSTSYQAPNGAYAPPYAPQFPNGAYQTQQVASPPLHAQTPQQAYFPPQPQVNGNYTSSPSDSYRQQQMYQTQQPSFLPPSAPAEQPSQPSYSEPVSYMASPPSAPQYGQAPVPATPTAPYQFQSPPQSYSPLVQSPPPPAQTPQAPSLSRHNTISTYHPPQSAQPTHYTGPVRHNTLSMSHAPQQLQQLQYAHVPAALPHQFPQVPSAPPQPYAPEPDRKEALLIDL